jgi:hypothetical protein
VPGHGGAELNAHHRIAAAAITIAVASVAPSSSSDQRPSMTPIPQRDSAPVVKEVAALSPASIAIRSAPDDPNRKDVKIVAWLILALKQARGTR